MLRLMSLLYSFFINVCALAVYCGTNLLASFSSIIKTNICYSMIILTLNVFGSLVAVYFAGFPKVLNLFGAAIFTRAVHSTFIEIVQYNILAGTFIGGYNC